MMRLFHVFALLISLIAWAGACQSQPDSPLSAAVAPIPRKQADCPDLDSRLFQLTQESAPLDLAKQWQLKVKDDKIQVLLILADEDVSFLQNFDVELGTQSDAKAQVFVPINQLCTLANTPEVLAIHPPPPIFTQ